MSEFVTVRIPRFLTDFRVRIERMVNEALHEAGPILRREEEASIRQRFYRTGEGLRSLQEQYITEGQKRIYRLFPTAFYMAFGEYGTGRRGQASGRPTPRGYRYGDTSGMTARRFSRLAVQTAKPQVEKVFERRAKAFAKNVTVN